MYFGVPYRLHESEKNGVNAIAFHQHHFCMLESPDPPKFSWRDRLRVPDYDEKLKRSIGLVLAEGDWQKVVLNWAGCQNLSRGGGGGGDH